MIRTLDDVRQMTEQGKFVTDLDTEYLTEIIKAILEASQNEIREVFQSVKTIDKFVS